MIENALGTIAKYEERRPKTVLLLFLIMTLALSSGFLMINTDTSQESQVPDDIRAITALNEIRDKLGGGSSSITLIYRIDDGRSEYIRDIRDLEVLKSMKKVLLQAQVNRFITGSSSILDIVDTDMDQNEVNQLLGTGQADGLLSEDNTITLLRLSVMNGLTDEQQEDVLNEVMAIADNTERPPGVDIDFAGDIALSQQIGRSIGSSTGFVTIVGFIGVFIAIYIFFRKFGFLFVTVTPVIFGTLWTVGSLGFMGIPLSSQLTGVFSIIIGLGIDFGIHILHRFEEDLKKTKRIDEAVQAAVRHIGRGLVLTTITTIAGFMALMFARLPLLRDFAIALSFGVTYSLIAAIGIIPPLLVIIEKRRMRRKRSKVQPSLGP